MEILIVYLIIINLIAFILYGRDKRKAIKNKWRIKESVLLSFALLGGGIGSFIAMNVFHHKTKKLKFIVCVPLFTVFFVVVIYYLNTMINMF